MSFLKNNKHLILYGFALAILILALKWLQWKFVIVDNAIDIYAGLVAVFFTGLGIWVATQLVKPKVETIIIEKEVLVADKDFTVNQKALEKLNLSEREYEVLQLLVKGDSNTAIAASLFLSVSTVKTHVSNLYVKMNVKSRTQAIAEAKKLQVIP